jgi:2-methylcitrate dehydratase PrpD
VAATAAVVDEVRSLLAGEVPAEALEAGRHCLLDWLGVALAGSREPLASIVRDETLAGDGGDEAGILGTAQRASAAAAALVNGTAGHALDYDDTHLHMSGHPTAPVAPAVVALGERLNSSGDDILRALIAGIEVECRIGILANPAHYETGWHATGTLGTFGAASAAAFLLGLDAGGWRRALGVAAAQAAGIKGLFGTMCKPLHAGKAAANGLLAGGLASRGFDTREDALEAPQGFLHCYGGDPGRAELAPGRFLVRDTLFKFHAACYLTHAPIEAALRLRVAPADIDAIEVFVNPSCLNVCNIEAPVTGLEGKFSLRATVAMALLGDDTAGTETFSDERVLAPDLVALRDRVTVVPAPDLRSTASRVSARTTGGATASATFDSGVPAADLDEQGRRLRAKFVTLAGPVIGAPAAEKVAQMVEDGACARELVAACRQ